VQKDKVKIIDGLAKLKTTKAVGAKATYIKGRERAGKKKGRNGGRGYSLVQT